MARKLAIVAKDRRVAIEVVTVVAERFKPDGPTDPGEQIKRGDELLEAAKKESAAKRFELQVEAAEWYVRAKLTGAGLNRELADKRLAEWRRPGEPLPGERSSGQRTAAMQSQLVGKWDIQHWPNRGKRTYIITPSGAVHFIEENRNTVLVRRENDILLDFGDGKLERLNPSNDRLFIEHFSPKSDFPDRPNQIGIGRRVEERQLKRKSE